MQRALSSSSRHYPALDGLRGIAVALVFVHHVFKYKAASGVGFVLHEASELGWMGVDLFFVLSGFLITGILLDSKGTKTYLSRFLLRRGLRIFPLYYLTIGVFFFVLRPLVSHFASPLPAPARPIWVYFLYLSNFSVAQDGWQSPADVSWSLAIEEQYYLVWPFVVAALGAAGLRKVLVGMIVLPLILRGMFYNATGTYWPSYVLPFCRVDSLAMGGLLALALRMPNRTFDVVLPRVARVIWAATLGAALTGLLHRETLFCTTFGYSLVAASAACLVWHVVRGEIPDGMSRALQCKPLIVTGQLSYAIYLFHVFVDAILVKAPRLRDVFAKDVLESNLVNAVAFLVLGATVTFGLAMLSRRFFELPVMRLKERLAP